MLGRKLGYRPSVLLKNAVRLDDEQGTPASRSAASKARRYHLPFLTSKSKDRNPSDRVAVSVSFPSGGVAGFLRLKKTRNHRGRWHHLFEQLDPLAVQIA